MSVSSSSAPVATRPGLLLAPLVAAVFLGMGSIGVPLPVLADQVHGVLGFGAEMAGLVVGAQSIATVLTRGIAGTLSDSRGAKRAVLAGLPCASLSGLLYLGSAWLSAMPLPSLLLLLAGRLLLGIAESLFLTGTMSWGITRLGPARTGTVMAWQGIALYMALAIGGPVGIAAQRAGGFALVALATILMPALALLIVLPLPAVPASAAARRPSFFGVLGLIWREGAALALGTTAVAAITAFVTLDFAAHGWNQAGLAFSGFGGGYILMRLLFAHLPDRLGGRPVAAVSFCVLTIGQSLLWLAPGQGIALTGAVLSGIGFSLVFPALGVEAMRRTTPEVRGLAVAGYVAFFDIALGIAPPICGVIATHAGYAAIYLAGAVSALAALVLVLRPERRS